MNMHAHDHDRDHGGHSHSVRRAQGEKSLRIVLVMVGCYMVAEVVGGIFSHSLALLGDAGHMLSDVASLGLTLFAAWIARRPSSSKRTYGYYRAEILAALFNGATLIAISILIVIEAIARLRTPSEIHPGIMIGVATGGFFVNLASMRLLGHSHSENLNMRAAWLHLFADALGSLGAVVAGLLIWKFGWNWADALASVLIAGLIVWSSWSLVRQSVNVLMEGVPAGIDVDEVRNAMVGVAGVCDVHDLHVWSISSGMESLSAHVIIAPEPAQVGLLANLRSTLSRRFGIEHVTIQLEEQHCGVAPHDA